MRITPLVSAAPLLVSCIVACGGDGDSQTPSNGSGGAAGSAGAAGSSGSGGGVAGSSGASGASGSGGSQVGTGGASGSSGSGGGGTSAGHCSPGTLFAEKEVWNGQLQQCDRYDAMANGLGTGGFASVREIIPPEPIVGGVPFSVSVVVKAAGPAQTVEFWGGGSSCGRAEEKLYSGPLDPGTICADMNPTQGHESILMVWPGSGSLFISDITVCMHGACP